MHETTAARLAEMHERRRNQTFTKVRSGTPPATVNLFKARVRTHKTGTFLAATITWLTGIEGSTSCGCKNLAKEMNQKGPDWCEQNLEYLVGKLMGKRDMLAEVTGVPASVMNSVFADRWLKVGARLLLWNAIRKDRAETAALRAKVSDVVALPMRRSALHVNSPIIPRTPIPFTAQPVTTLVFHVWPHGDGWRRHLEKLAPIVDSFDRKILGVAYDHTTATVAEVVEAFGCDWEVVEVENNLDTRTGLREVATYQKIFPMLPTGVNDVTFCAHAKGAQKHTARSEPVTWWTDAMYDTILYNRSGVIDAMDNGAGIVGSFRRHGNQLGVRHRWHYSGTFYAIRNHIAFNSGVPAFQQRWWGTESWPGDHFPLESSHCIFADNSGDLYSVAQQPRLELEQWKAER